MLLVSYSKGRNKIKKRGEVDKPKQAAKRINQTDLKLLTNFFLIRMEWNAREIKLNLRCRVKDHVPRETR